MWQDVCRTCLKMDKSLLNIFEHHKNNKLISELLIELITIQIPENDGLPRNICDNCLEKLNIACDFKTLALECNTKLHQLHVDNDSVGKSANDILNSDFVTDAEDSTIFIKKEKTDLTSNDFNDDNDYQNEENFIGNGQEIFKPINKEEFVKSEDNFNADENDRICNLSSNTNECSNEDLRENHSKDEDLGEDDVDSIIKSFTTEYDYLKDTLTRDEKSKMKLLCKICNKTVGFNYYFSIHLREHIGEVPFECAICKKRFPTQPVLKAHETKHSDHRPFKCDICAMDFKLKGSFNKHKLVHQTDHPYKCKICKKTFKIEFYLKTHLMTHEEDREKPYVCEICGKKFTSMRNVNLHKTIHNPLDSVRCSKCDKSFKNKKLLHAHMRSHAELKSHLCSYCGKGFKKPEVLKTHVRIHTGEKPYTCKVCGKSFRDSSTIPRHMRIHTGEKPYNCEKCPRTFRYSYELKRHVQSSHSD